MSQRWYSRTCTLLSLATCFEDLVIFNYKVFWYTYKVCHESACSNNFSAACGKNLLQKFFQNFVTKTSYKCPQNAFVTKFCNRNYIIKYFPVIYIFITILPQNSIVITFYFLNFVTNLPQIKLFIRFATNL